MTTPSALTMHDSVRYSESDCRTQVICRRARDQEAQEEQEDRRQPVDPQRRRREQVACGHEEIASCKPFSAG